MEKKIEVVKRKVGDLKNGFGNPRNITKKKLEELRKSFELYGDFGVFIIDENEDLIGGTQRATVLKEMNPDQEVTCKKLIGYSREEKMAINIKDNTHAGDWDLDILADWQADLTVDLGLDPKKKSPEERAIPDMELIHYEKYDYVMIVCRNELDYNDLVRKLGIENRKVQIAKSRKIKARAIWYDKMKAKIVPIEDSPEEKKEEG